MSESLSPSIRLRLAQPSDVTAIAMLGAHVFSVTFGHSVPAPELQAYLTESYSEAATTKDLEDPSKDLVVALNENDAVVGFALLSRGTIEPCVAELDKTIELQRVYVDPAYHGKGYGKRLIQRLEEMARNLGFKHMWLGVWEENIKAQEVYKKLGYVMVGNHDFRIGGIVQTDYIMLKAF